MKTFLLTLHCPGYKGALRFDFRLVKAQNIGSAKKKMRKEIRRWLGNYYRFDAEPVLCEEISDTHGLYERVAEVNSAIEETRAKLAALELEQFNLRRLCATIEGDAIK